MNFQVFLGERGLRDRIGVVFPEGKTVFWDHESRKWIFPDGDSYPALLNTATKLAPDADKVNVDWRLLNLCHFCSWTVKIHK